jgi:hypothetical protein
VPAATLIPNLPAKPAQNPRRRKVGGRLRKGAPAGTAGRWEHEAWAGRCVR